jgi:2'-hydroxyisoflavone reductase
MLGLFCFSANDKVMNLLVLGGTLFLGRHLVDAALTRGHTLTLFHRGKTNPGLFPEVTEILGDRTDDSALAQLEGLRFDAVIDTCGYIPRVVRMSAQRLAGNVGRYCFLSSVSVYPNWPDTSTDEDAPVGIIEDPTLEQITGETYGPLKALCEQEAQTAFPEGALIIRPGLIVGPHDPSDRFTYWPHRVAQGGEILAPASAELPTQWIDVRDLAEWTIHLLERGNTGVYNADGPVVSLGQLLATCFLASGAQGSVTYAEEAFLQEQEVKPWLELPLWIPGVFGKKESTATRTQRANLAGLTYRTALETVRDTLLWDQGRTTETAWKNTLTREKEAAVLAAWKSRTDS